MCNHQKGRNFVLLIHNGKHSRSKKNINTFLYFLNKILRFFKSSILHSSFMEKILLVKIQTNVNQRKHMHNTLCQKLLVPLKSRILTIKIGLIVLCKNLFFFARLNRLLYFWVFKCQSSAFRFLNH